MMKSLILFLLSCCCVYGEDLYVAQSSAGSNNGSSCANAFAISFFNTSGNWGAGAGKISAGDTVHLCGTITTEIATQGSGSSGSPIIIVFETGAKIQISPGMDSNSIINLGANNYITLNGGTACGWNTATNVTEGTCNGIVRNMLYGSANGVCPGGTCTTQFNQTANAMIVGTGHDIEIKNLDIGPAYVHTSTGAGATDGNGTGCINAINGSNWNIHSNKIHDGVWCVNIEWMSGTMSNITVANNELYNNSHDLAVDGVATLNGFTLSGNYSHDHFNWDTTGDDNHANFVHFFTSVGDGTATNIGIYNNIIGGNTGADITASGIFSEQFTSYGPIAIFNNLLITSTSPDLGASNHFWGPSQCDTGCFVYNNTSARQTTTGGNLDLGFSGTMSATIENNVLQNASTQVAAAVSTSLTFDYNAYGPPGSWVWHGTFVDFTDWKTDSGEGSHSFYNPSGLTLAGNFKPASGSPLIGAGINVCTANPTFCSSFPAIMNDLAGVARPSSGAWDIGAYQFGSSSAPTVTTTTATSISTTTASSGGSVTSDGGASVTSRGACYGASSNPTTPCTSDGTGTGSFTSTLSSLSTGTLYHYRAFATNSVGTSYGSDLTFTTLSVLPSAPMGASIFIRH